jgi:hypothetical protein
MLRHQRKKRCIPVVATAAASSLVVIALWPLSVGAVPTEFFSTGNPDGLIGTLSRPDTGGVVETESADDFVLTGTTQITGATFTGLIPAGTAAPTIGDVRVEIYRVFPNDSNVGRTSGPPTFSTPQVPTRVNSPSDVEFGDRDTSAGSLNFNTDTVTPSFSVSNTVVNGINKSPGQFTGGEGPATGQEIKFNVTFTTPFTLPADQYFFIPQVQVTGSEFLWLSAPKPIVPPGTPFPAGFTDLQEWIRNENLAPDWLRVGTDITHQGPFNATFSLIGQPVPEPSTFVLLAIGCLTYSAAQLRRRQ